MENYSSKINYFPRQGFGSLPTFSQRPWFRSHRFVIFIAVFLFCLIVSLPYLYSRPPVYRSSATLLTSAMPAIDSEANVADSQHVAIQKQILLGHELVEETLSRLKESEKTSPPLQLTVSDIRNLMDVQPVSDTNLVEVLAEGSDPGFLPVLINTWIDVYLDARAEEVKKLTSDTTQIIKGELEGLADKINTARIELEAFRKNNNILSTGREENESLARLNGLTASLNKALDDEVRAKANLDAIKTAIADNQTVVPRQDQGSLQTLEKRLQELREKLAELDKRFTRSYLYLQPKLKVIPEQIKKLEAEIKTARQYGKNIVLTEAEREYAAARQTVNAIRGKLNEHKQEAAKFTAKFAEHERLKTDLEGLEKLYRDTKERLVQIETSQREKYPQVSVINRAYLSTDPIRPKYHRDALIAIASSLFLGLFAVWISDYLTRKPEPESPITFSGIHLYPREADMIHYQPPATTHLERQKEHALESPLHRELSGHELSVLINASTLKGKQLIALLLSGLTLEEAASLTEEQIDLKTATITVTGPASRTLSISRPLLLLFEQSGGYPDWVADSTASQEGLAATLICAAVDSGLPNPMEISVDAIRHSYICYLVRQGLRLSDLGRIVGKLEPKVLSGYSTYSPPQKGRDIGEIELVHPALNENYVA